MQVLKTELRQRILDEARSLFLEKGYDHVSLQEISNKVRISKSNLYHYFKSKEELFYALTDSAAIGLRDLTLLLREHPFAPDSDAREYHMLITEEITSLLLREKYGLLLIVEQSQGTRYEALRDSLAEFLATRFAPLLPDQENRGLLSHIMAYNLIGGAVQILKNRSRPRETRVSVQLLLRYHNDGIRGLIG